MAFELHPGGWSGWNKCLEKGREGQAESSSGKGLKEGTLQMGCVQSLWEPEVRVAFRGKGHLGWVLKDE